VTLAKDLLDRTKSLNRRTLDPIGAKLFFYFCHFHDCLKTSPQIQPYIIASLRTATLRQDNDTQATLLNATLKNYLELNLIDQADKLVSKTVFPETVGNNLLARYLYYIGKDFILTILYRKN
jgi:26S proteasome regulatory subunit N3